MATVLEIIEARAPEYVNMPNLNVFIELAENKTNESCMGANYNEAVALLAMHTIALSKRSNSGAAPGGGIASEKEGELSRSYSSSPSMTYTDSNLSQTSWGLELIQLTQATIVPFTNRMFNDDC